MSDEVERVELKVQFGSGGNILEGWKNHDLDHPIQQQLRYQDATVSMILAEHVVEHVSPSEALTFLMECHRVLKPGGVLRVIVPSIERIDIEHGRDIVRGHGHQAVYSLASIWHMLRLAGFNPTHIKQTNRRDIDGHWREIGEKKDEMESVRLEAQK